MITPMIVSFRECLEMLIIIVPVLAYLHKNNRLDLSKYIYLGSLAGLLTTLLTAGLILGQVATLEGYSKELFEGSMFIFLAALILYNIVWIGKSRKTISLDANEHYTSNLTGASLFLLSFLTIFRESLEIIMFIIPLVNDSPIEIALGIGAGMFISLILAYLLFKTALKLNINMIFGFLSLTLIFIGGVLFGEGIYQIFPNFGESIELAAQLIFTLPLLFLFLKQEMKRYLKK